MSVISALFDNKVYNFEQAFGVKDITSAAMRQAIREWYALYYDTEPTEQEDPGQRLPVAVVSKLTRTAFSEYTAQVSGQSSKSAFLAGVLTGLDRARKAAIQQALIGGEAMLKPLPSQKGTGFTVIGRNNYLVLGRNEFDEITDIGTAEVTDVGRVRYTLLERRTVDAAGYLTIESRLFRSDNTGYLGYEVPLPSLDKYAALERLNRLPQPVWSAGLISLKMPIENTVDGSPDGVSVYAAAARLIRLININEAQINGEFSRGESRIIVSSDLMNRDQNGRKQFKDHVFSGLDDDSENVGVTIFSPAFREQSFFARKMEYLRSIESLIGLKRGILSEVEVAERTATEVTSSAGDYNLTIIDLQQMWERAVREAVRVCDIIGQMYKLCDSTPVDPMKEISVSWGNGILYDEKSDNAERLAQVQAGLLKPELYLAWYYDQPCETDKDIAAIRAKYMPEIEEMAGGDE